MQQDDRVSYSQFSSINNSLKGAGEVAGLSKAGEDRQFPAFTTGGSQLPVTQAPRARLCRYQHTQAYTKINTSKS